MSQQRSTIQSASEETALETIGSPGIHVKGKLEHLGEGTLINGRYRSVQLLGEGGMGVVYHAQDTVAQGRDVAVKMINAIDMNADQLSLFKAEFSALSRLKHPNVAGVYDFEQMQGTKNCFFTMELINGTNIMQATEGQPIDKVVDYIVQTCRALSYIHSRNVLHLDLKPQNIMVTSSGTVKVLDFGLTGAASRQRVGTPAFVSPERLQGTSVDHRADLYSLGIVAFQLATRRMPYDTTAGISAVFNQHITKPVKFEDGDQDNVPVWLQEIILRLCQKSPDARFRNANSVIEAINSGSGRKYEIYTEETKESYVLSGKFVARETELNDVVDFVQHRLRGTPARNGEAALLVGAMSGVGKSRLLAEARHQIQLSHFLFWTVNCYEVMPSEFAPITGLVSHAIAALKHVDESDSILKEFGPELVKLIPHLPFTPTVPLAPDAERRRIIQNVSNFVIKVSLYVPFVVYINDLQWAPTGTTETIRNLLQSVWDRETAGMPVKLAVLGTYRNNEVNDRPIATLLAKIKTETLGRTIELLPLHEGSIAQLLTSMLGVDTLPASFVKDIFAEAQGNPFFIEEILRALVQNGVVYVQDGAWAARNNIDTPLVLPKVNQVFLSRADKLTASQRRVVDIIATYGRPMPVRFLQHASALSMNELVECLSTLHQLHMAERVPNTDDVQYQVCHDRMREALYGSYTEQTRQGLHQSIMTSIEASPERGTNEAVYDLAHHAWQAKDTKRAYAYCVQAGQLAQAAHSNVLAAQMLQRALDLSPSGSADTVALRERLADIYSIVGMYSDALEHYAVVFDACSTAMDKARLWRKRGLVYFNMGEMPQACAHVHKAVALLNSAMPKTMVGFLVAMMVDFTVHLLQQTFARLRRPSFSKAQELRNAELANAYYTLAWVHFFFEPNLFPLAVLRASNYAERQREETPLLSLTRSFCGGLYDTLLFFGAGAKFHEQALAIADRLNDAACRSNALTLRGIHHFYQGQWKEAVEACSAGKAIARRIGDVWVGGLANVHLFYSLDYLGREAEAKKECLELQKTLERTGSIVSLFHYYMLARSQGRFGEYEAALKNVQTALEIAEPAKDLLATGKIYMEYGEIHLWMGEPEKAIAKLESARRVREKTPLPHDYVVRLYPILARAYIDLSLRSGKGSKQETEALAKARKMLRVGLSLTTRRLNYRTMALTQQARYEVVTGNAAEGERVFAEAFAQGERLGANLQLADAYWTAAKCLGSTAKAMQFKDKATALYKECGVEPPSAV